MVYIVASDICAPEMQVESKIAGEYANICKSICIKLFLTSMLPYLLADDAG